MRGPLSAYNRAGGFVMRKSSVRVLVCCLGLLLTAGLILLWPAAHQQDEQAPTSPKLIRVWVQEGESAVCQWLRKRANAYEKEAKARVYVRSASAEEAEAAKAGQEGILPPDLTLSPRGGEPVALRGYALILRDDTAPVVTPSPTFSLFARPTQAPAPALTPAPLTEADLSRRALVPPECADALPNALKSAAPLSDFIQGKADAALLTAAQAAQLPFGYRAYALKDGRGMTPVCAQALSESGEGFLRFLLARPSQAALCEHGLYSPRFPCYQGQDSLYALIESGWNYP